MLAQTSLTNIHWQRQWGCVLTLLLIGQPIWAAVSHHCMTTSTTKKTSSASSASANQPVAASWPNSPEVRRVFKFQISPTTSGERPKISPKSLLWWDLPSPTNTPTSIRYSETLSQANSLKTQSQNKSQVKSRRSIPRSHTLKTKMRRNTLNLCNKY